MQHDPSPPVHSGIRKRRDTVRLKFWGARGSIPTPGHDTVKFGGNTTCAELRADGQHIILDAGSGLRELGMSLEQEFGDNPLDLTILLTHTHWDHIQGFPFFSPAYKAKNKIRIIGHEGARQNLQRTLEVQMESPYFPVSFKDMPGSIIIEEMKEPTLQLGSVTVRSARTKHPGITVGYRLETSAGSVCFVPDHEASPGETFASVSELINGAELLLLDSQYTAEEYPAHAGWGHGCLDDVVRIAGDAGAKRLYLFHHDPSHSDEFIEGMVARARELASGYDMDVDAAREGEQVVLVCK
jgi:phosphoribosyl 1,2-cyclic phosphodiesterase